MVATTTEREHTVPTLTITENIDGQSTATVKGDYSTVAGAWRTALGSGYSLTEAERGYMFACEKHCIRTDLIITGGTTIRVH